MTERIVPAGDTITDLEKKAKECEELAATAAQSLGAQLREKAALCREWIKQLKSGRWTS